MDFAYPRPQLVRSAWTSLNGSWRFRFDHERAFCLPSQVTEWPLRIEVPFAPEAELSGIGDRGFHRACWYEREFDAKAGGKRVILHFGAVDYLARVWVNGKLAAVHEGGYTPFAADITDLLDPGGRQTVTVQAEDDPADLEKPRGKQDWQLEPHSIWYPRTTGIWQTVWLEHVPRTYIRKLRFTPQMDDFSITVEARVGGDELSPLHVEVVVRHGARVLADDRYQVLGDEVDRRIIVSDPGIDDYRNELLWSPERPTLLDVTVRLVCDGKVLDEVTSYTALRSANILRDRFMLNGRPYFLRMVLDQGYWPESLLTPPSDDALRRDVELAKAMGFNGVRKHQKLESPRYLYWADKLGLLVWDEMPSAYRFTSTAIKRQVREWSEAIERDASHPCVVVWVPFNESWGVPDLPSTHSQRSAVEALYHLTKTLDPTRMVVGNDGWEASATDIIGIHDYDGDAEAIRLRYGPDTKTEQLFDRRRPGGRILTLDGYPHRGQPIMLTEFGGIALRAHAQQGAWGYSDAADPGAFASAFARLMETVIHMPLFSGFCYTQFCDTFQEANGLLTADRTPKIPLDAIRAATTMSRTFIPGGV